MSPCFYAFHGAIDPPTGSGAAINGNPAGNGGCHPVDGCQDGDGFSGADYRHLSANVIDGRPVPMSGEVVASAAGGRAYSTT